MTISVTRDRTGKMRHIVAIREHRSRGRRAARGRRRRLRPVPARPVRCRARSLQGADRGLVREPQADPADGRRSRRRARRYATSARACIGCARRCTWAATLTDGAARGTAHRRRQVPGAQADDSGHAPKSPPRLRRRSPCRSSTSSTPHEKDLGGGFLVRRLLPASATAGGRSLRVLRPLRPGRRAARRTTTTCARIRTSAWPPSRICSKARCCTGTAWARCSASNPAPSTG